MPGRSHGMTHPLMSTRRLPKPITIPRQLAHCEALPLEERGVARFRPTLWSISRTWRRLHVRPLHSSSACYAFWQASSAPEQQSGSPLPPCIELCRSLVAYPGWLALLQEREHALLCIDCQRVHAHHLFGIGISFRLIQIDLAIECLFAKRNSQRAGMSNREGKIASSFFEHISRNHLIDQPPFCCRLCRDGLAGKQHLKRTFPSNSTAQRHHWRRAKEANFHAWRRKTRLFSRNCQIAGGNKLAPSSSGNTMHARNDGLRDCLDRRHQFSADIKDIAIVVDRPPHQLAQIVTSRECWPLSRQDDCAYSFIAS